MCLIKLWKIFQSKSSSCKLNNRALCYVIKISLVLKLRTVARKRRAVVSIVALLKTVLFSPKQSTITTRNFALPHKTLIKLTMLLKQVVTMKVCLLSKNPTLKRAKLACLLVGSWPTSKKLFFRRKAIFLKDKHIRNQPH